jgi:hypothetical protein
MMRLAGQESLSRLALSTITSLRDHLAPLVSAVWLQGRGNSRTMP